MARVQHNCTGCVPIDASIIDVYIQLIGLKDRTEEAAERAEYAAEHAIGKSPYIGENGDWWEWDDEQGAFIDTGVQAQGSIAVDIAMSSTSTNPVQNKVITAALNGKYTKPASGIPSTDIAPGVIPDVSQFITASVNNLVNYYLKSETYNKTEVDSLIAAVSQFSYEVVASLPTASASTMYKIYLVPSQEPKTQNVKDEYITIRSGSAGAYTYAWEQIGSTAIDLSGYVTTEQLNTALGAYTTTANLTTLLAAKQDVIADLATIRSGASAGATAYQKPGTGIPKTDLASGVQASLDLADSAIQARPMGEVDPTITPAEYATKEELDTLEHEVDDVDAKIEGSNKSTSISIDVAGGVAISGNNRYPTNAVIKTGQYNISYNGGGVLSRTYIYFYDSGGNAVKPKNNLGNVVSSIDTNMMSSYSPYTFETEVASVLLYDGTPSADGTIVFSFESTEPPQMGLREEIGTLSDLNTVAKNSLVNAINEVNTGKKLLPIFTKTQIENTDIHTGYWWNGETLNQDYFYIHFTNLKEGDVILLRKDHGEIRSRFLRAYAGATAVDAESDNSDTLSVYRVGAGIDNAYMSFHADDRTANTYAYHITFDGAKEGTTPAPYIVTADNLVADAISTISEALEIKKNVKIEYYAKFDSFSPVKIGQGKGHQNGAWVEITSTAVNYYLGSSSSIRFTQNHGLTLSTYVHIVLSIDEQSRVIVTISTFNGTATLSPYNWAACAGAITATAGMATTKVSLSYFSGDLLKDISLYGDSYISFSEDRYPYYLKNTFNCLGNILTCGISGGAVGYTLPALLENVKQMPPKIIIWALGMNDADTSSAINKSWKNATDFVANLCTCYGIRLILATIPNVPSYRHTFKNAYVKASGYRYIDFANAVNAEEAGATWYPGMLYTDNVHPTELGAKTLAERFVNDAPEVLLND